jgi:hypothetical protein
MPETTFPQSLFCSHLRTSCSLPSSPRYSSESGPSLRVRPSLRRDVKPPAISCQCARVIRSACRSASAISCRGINAETRSRSASPPSKASRSALNRTTTSARITTAAAWFRSGRAESRNSRATPSGLKLSHSIISATAWKPTARAATAIACVSINADSPYAGKNPTAVAVLPARQCLPREWIW